MKFYVILMDGRRFGPVDVPTLIEWAKQDRVKRDSDLENAENGQRLKARDLPGMKFPSAAGPGDGLDFDPALKSQDTPSDPQQGSAPTSAYEASRPAVTGSSFQAAGPTPTGGQEQPGTVYQNPPQPGSPYPRAQGGAHDDGSQKMVTNAWILIAISFFCSCFILPPFAIVQANKAKALGHPGAQAPLVVAWILTALFGIAIIVNVIIFLVMGATAFGM